MLEFQSNANAAIKAKAWTYEAKAIKIWRWSASRPRSTSLMCVLQFVNEGHRDHCLRLGPWELLYLCIAMELTLDLAAEHDWCWFLLLLGPQIFTWFFRLLLINFIIIIINIIYLIIIIFPYCYCHCYYYYYLYCCWLGLNVFMFEKYDVFNW